MKIIHIGMWTPDRKFHSLSLVEKIKIIEDEFKKAREIAFQASKDKNSLFIFLCPEYTFINPHDNKTGAYTKTDARILRDKFNKLAAAYPDSIIVPGTMLIQRHLHPEKDEARKQKYTQRLFNASKHYQLDHLTITEKNKLLSEIDSNGILITNVAYLFAAYDKKHKYGKKAPSGDVMYANIATFMPGHNSAFIHTKGLHIGMEICADHCAAALVKEQSHTPNEPVNIHLILSKTVDLNTSNIARGAGIVINCAGDFVNSRNSQLNTAVWMIDKAGSIKKLAPVQLKQTLVFHNIPVPEKTPALRAKL